MGAFWKAQHGGTWFKDYVEHRVGGWASYSFDLKLPVFPPPAEATLSARERMFLAHHQ